MVISIIGTNGLLATEIGQFCNKMNYTIKAYGRNLPKRYTCNEFYKIDLCDKKFNLENISNSDVVFYTAGAGIQSNLNDSISLIYKLNTFVPIKISNSLIQNGFKNSFVTFGSYFEIGNNNKSVKYSEKELINSELEVPNDYCISKRLLTKYISSINKNRKHLHIILPTIYSEKEEAHRLIPYTIKSIKEKKQMLFTSGIQIRQYIYSGDVPKIIFDLININSYGIFNISGNNTSSIKEIIEKIHLFYKIKAKDTLYGKTERLDVGMSNLQIDDTKLKKTLPNIEYTSFDESLKFYDKCL